MAGAHLVNAQCAGAQGDQTSYGNGSWIGYVYDGANTFTTANYQGYITESETFDESFCGDNCTQTIHGCSINTETFSVRFKMKKNFTAGLYKITIAGDDGVRISVDGGSSYLINGYVDQSFTSYSANTWLSGQTYLVFEYYEANAQNRVSFSYTYLGSSYGGEIADSQTLCGSGSIDPAAFTSVDPAYFTGNGTTQYRWQESTDNSSWSNISGATGLTYDIPAGFPAGTTKYYRRRAKNGSDTEYSNTLTVIAQAPSGDQVTAGTNSWIGYVYDGANNFSSNYVGAINEVSTFDENFGGDYVNKSTSGCDIYTETFSVRFKMNAALGCGDYVFTVGADDGVRLSVDGGSTWLVNDYSDHGYRTVSSTTTHLTAGTYHLVIEYYENGGGNRVSFNYTYTANCAMPVTLSQFNATAEGQTVLLNWSTASEENNKGFYVVRTDGTLSFQTIGWVNGHGNSNKTINYTFTDAEPPAGTVYYRLRQVDYDGKEDYSPVAVVTIEQPAIILVYPNPATDYINIRVPGMESSTIQAWLVDGAANRVQLNASPDQDGTFDVRAMSRGTYILVFRTLDGLEKRRIILQ